MCLSIVLAPIGFVLMCIIIMGIIWGFNDKFDYNSAKQITVEYLNKNEKNLNKVVNELYENKNSKNNPLKNIGFASYDYLSDFNFKEKTEYIIFNFDGQGALGGQYYGLIYSFSEDQDLIIYDEYKEKNNGNNIFVRQKIKDNWYFYYDDFDGKLDTSKIK